jgi:uncharacterized membrane protein YqhA
MATRTPRLGDPDRLDDPARHDEHLGPGPTPTGPFAREIGRTRFVVLVAVASVLLIAMALFLLGAWKAATGVWKEVQVVFSGQASTTDLTVEFLEIVSVMLKAVVFYIIGVGLYSLFIAPLNVTAALGVETLNDLEAKIISVIVVIMGVTFLEHFIRWEGPNEIFMFGGTMALVVAALVLFQFQNHWAREEQRKNDPDTQARAQRQLFHLDREQREVETDEEDGTRNGPSAAGRASGGRSEGARSEDGRSSD